MILFVGNALSRRGRAVSYTEFLVEKLSGDFGGQVKLVSSYRNQILRILHASFAIIRNVQNLDVVVVDVFSTKAFYYAYFIARMVAIFDLPYVLVLHGGNLPSRFSRNPRLVGQLLGKAKSIVSPSLYLSEFFSSKGYSVRWIGNALNIPYYVFGERRYLGKKLLWVRAFDKIYNPIMAIKAVEKIPFDVSLTMVGPEKDVSKKECLNFIAQKGLTASVRLTGLLLREEWLALADECDIFLNTTTIDNQPVSVLEAMAKGLLVISTNVGGIPYIIKHGENGFLVPNDDPDAMARQIMDILNMPPDECARISRNARLYAEQFDWERIKPQWINLLSA